MLTNDDFKAIDIELCQRSLSEFAKQAWHVLEPSTPLKWGWCLDAICDHLEAVNSGQIKRLLMNVPPASMKSLLTGVLFPAWEWAKGQQELRYLGTAHNQVLAVRDNMKCRRLIQSEWYQSMFGVELTSDQNAKTKFENSKTGFREACAFTSMTGSRGDRIILDDPLSADDGNSQAALESTRITFTETLPSRVNNEDSAIIVIMQRLNEADTSGVILDLGLPYEHLVIPMRYEQNGKKSVTCLDWRDPRTIDGELMFPDRFPENQVKELEKTLGTYATAGQLQQRPAPRGGGLFKKHFIQNYDPSNLPEFDNIDISIDSAFKTGAENDYSAIGVWGKCDNGYYLLSAIREKVEFPQLKSRVEQLCEYWKPRFCLIEDKASGQSLIQELIQSTLIPIKPIKVDTDKLTRAYAIQPEWENGKIFLPFQAEWLNDYINELTVFPSAKHDDQVDMTTQYINFQKSFRELDLWVV